MSTSRLVPSAEAIPSTSIPSNDPSTPLSPTLYKFIILLVAFLVLFWILRVIVRGRKIVELWKGIRDENVVRVEGPGAAAHLTRASLHAILRARTSHTCQEIEQIQVKAHVPPKLCKVVRMNVTPTIVNKPPSSSALSLTVHSPSSSSSAMYHLNLLVTATTVVKLEVYVGVSVKLVQLLHRAHDKFMARHTNILKPKQEKLLTTAATTTTTPMNTVPNEKTSPSPTSANVTHAPNEDECKTAVHPSSIELAAMSPSANDLPVDPPPSPSPSPSPSPLPYPSNADSTASIVGSDAEHAAFLRSYIQESMAAGSNPSLFRADEYKWKSSCFILQPPPPLASSKKPKDSSSDPTTVSSSSSQPFQQSFAVPIPVSVLQRVCRDHSSSSSHSQPSNSRTTYPILIHVAPVDAFEHRSASLSKSVKSRQIVSELTLAELLPSFHSSSSPSPPPPPPSDSTPAMPTGSNDGAPNPSTQSVAMAQPASPSSEDYFLSKLKFERQFLLVSTKPSSHKSHAPPIANVYEIEELYGLNRSIPLPDVSAPSLAPSSTSTRSTGVDGSNECVVCMSEAKDIILLPCRHVCLCHSCHENVDKCPVCRGPIMSHMRFVEPAPTSGSTKKRKVHHQRKNQSNHQR